MSSSKQFMQDLRNGNDDVIAPAAGNHFPAARKFLRMKGVRDVLTPKLYAAAFANVVSEVRRKRVPEWSDFQHLLNNALAVEVAHVKSKEDTKTVFEETQSEIAAQCVMVLDVQARKLLFLRYAENKSYEEIAALCNYSNPVIAQFEVEKAYRQYEGIVTVRLNMQPN